MLYFLIYLINFIQARHGISQEQSVFVTEISDVYTPTHDSNDGNLSTYRQGDYRVPNDIGMRVCWPFDVLSSLQQPPGQPGTTQQDTLCIHQTPGEERKEMSSYSERADSFLIMTKTFPWKHIAKKTQRL